MGVFSRMSDIVNSNINAMLDKAEDPEKMVSMIIREMNETLVEVRTTAAKAIADKKRLTRENRQRLEEVEHWQNQAEIAIRKDRDDLARAALTERKKAEHEVEIVSEELKAVESMLEKLNLDIQTLDEKLGEAKARKEAILLRGQAAQARLGVRKQLSHRNIDDAMERFELYERQMDDLEGKVESFDVGKKSLSEEIDNLVVDEEIESDLEELKRSVKSDGES